MATLIPEVPGACTGSERLLFNRFERELDDDCVVIHSLGLANHDKKVWGEADFVVLSTKGIFAIEVKGGEVACHDGVWHFGKPGGRGYYTKRESPFEQAKDAMFAVKKRLDAQAALSNLVVGYGVVMPHAVFEATGAEIEPEVLLDSRNYSRPLGFFIGQLSRHWMRVYVERHGRSRLLPTAAQIKDARQLLRPDIDTTLRLGSYINGLEQDLIQLSNQQIRAARGMANNHRTIISGRAGTGKTVLAIDRAETLAKAGDKVLYLCFNRLLAKHVKLSLRDREGSENINVRHIHGLMREAIGRAGLEERLQSAEVSEPEFFGRVFPEIFVEAALTCEPDEADVLVVDEAQDLLTTANLDALDLLVRRGLKQGRWHMFVDPLQNIYSKESTAVMSVLGAAGYASFELFQNCRNTRQVAIQASLISGLDMALEGAITGLSCDCVYFSDVDECRSLVNSEIRDLLKGGVLPKDIVILSPRRLANSILAGIDSLASLMLRDLTEVSSDENVISFCTMHAFKGLERKIVLVVDLENIGDEHLSMLHYAGLSRAIVLLRPFLAASERSNYEHQARAFGTRMARA